MRVFVTGATGFVGSAVVQDLIAAGHKVLGLSRSEEKAKALTATGAEVHLGTLQDLEGLKKAAAKCDGIIHLAFNHDFSTYQTNCEDDRRVIEALGSILAGSNRPLVITSGITSFNPDRPAVEDDAPVSSTIIPRAASEEAAAALAASGVNVSVVRLPQVHDTYKYGLISPAIEIAREKKVSAYIGDGMGRWPAVHLTDAARLYRLALEKAERGANYHAVAEEGVTMRAIAEAIARRMKIPAVSITQDEAPGHFGWLAFFAGRDAPASSAQTRKRLGWQPTGPGLIADLENGHYA